ncbi:hypothetical protein V9T40_000642 [Parthenolecanium corni]|uniref:Ubiquitin-like protein ATG12 n=1 Tax=Parthenolecanium corni TaxID=536013 RepID=A0AAN9T9P6_9HEMI
MKRYVVFVDLMASETCTVQSEEYCFEQNEELSLKIQDVKPEPNSSPLAKESAKIRDVKLEPNSSPSAEESEKIQDEKPESNSPPPAEESAGIQEEKPESNSLAPTEESGEILEEKPESSSPAAAEESDHDSLPEKKKQSSVDKITVILQPIANAPIVGKNKWIVDPSRNLGSLSLTVRKLLKLKTSESLILYVNQFSPPLDQVLSNLFECFGIDGVLHIQYCTMTAYG